MAISKRFASFINSVDEQPGQKFVDDVVSRQWRSDRSRGKAVGAIIDWFSTHSKLRGSELQGAARTCGRILVALRPFSLDAMTNILLERDADAARMELRFSLICFMGEVIDDDPGLRIDCSKKFGGLIQAYLISGESRDSCTIWLAAHTLGVHCSSKQATDALINVVKSSRFRESRVAAIRMLGEIMNCTRNSDRIVDLLENTIDSDRSREVREVAQFILKQPPHPAAIPLNTSK